MNQVAKVTVIHDFKLPATPGVHHRILCMTGKNKGTSYFLNDKRLVLGRGENVDIPVLDNKSSREHAELTLFRDCYILTDLGSQNGVLVNELKITQHQLKDGDKFIIGQTVFRYNRVTIEQVITQKIEQPLENIESNISDEKSLDANKKRTMIMLTLFAICAYMIFSIDSDTSKTQKRSSSRDSESMTDDEYSSQVKKKQKELDKEQEKRVNAAIHKGLREFREKNYYRAMSEFNMARILSPQHALANFYLLKTKQALDNEIQINLLKASYEADALKYKSAIVAFCAVIKLIEDKKDDPRYIRAEKGIEEMEEKLGIEKGETKCSSE